MIQIAKQAYAVEKEPLRSSFGFKGGSAANLWQSIGMLQTESGAKGVGLGVQSPLWSDASVFARYGEQRSNEMMSELTRFALEQAVGFSFTTPFELFEYLLPLVEQYGKQITAKDDMRLTFALNPLVCVDHAAWILYGQERRSLSLLEIVPEAYSRALPRRSLGLAGIPAIFYGAGEEEIKQLLEDGSFLLKLKLGADPEGDGDQEKMLEWDKNRLSQVHRLSQDYRSEYTDSGKIAYYLDTNGRYDGKERVVRLLEHADRIGALEHIVLFEEPFAEEVLTDVSDLPVRMASDESVHNEEDALERIDLGYKALALKPVAKTMSLSLKIAKLALERGIPCFCADLTVNPLLADWNKCLAACLPPIPGLKIGALETNGYQNYLHWDRLQSYHPRQGAPWTNLERGIYPINDDFYRYSGGALENGAHYISLV